MGERRGVRSGGGYVDGVKCDMRSVFILQINQIKQIVFLHFFLHDLAMFNNFISSPIP